MPGYSVAVVEDHLMQRKYVTALLNHQPDLHVVFGCEELPELMAWMESTDRRFLPDLVLLDLLVDRRPHANPRTVRDLVTSPRAKTTRVILFSALSSPPLVRQMIRAGVHGVISKRDNEARVLEAIRTVLAGGTWVSSELTTIYAGHPRRPHLSDQEERALVLYATGCSIEEVADTLGVKPGTTKKYLQRVRNKYAAVGRTFGSRLEMARAAAEDGYLVAIEGRPRP